MEILKERIDYKAILRTFKEFVDYYKDFDIPFEDPANGNVGYMKISSMSMHLINNEFFGIKTLNGIFESQEYVSNPQFMIKVWISNGKKVSSFIAGYPDFPVNVEAIKIFLSFRIKNVLKSAIYEFFSEKVKNNKYHLKRSQKVDVYIEDFDDMKVINGDVLKESLKQGSAIYNIKNVVEISHAFGLQRYVNIVIDTEGREILNKRDIIKSICIVDFVNSENIRLEEVVADYVLTEKELLLKVSGYYDIVYDKIKINDKRIYIDSGIYPIVFDNYSSHTFFHEAIGGHLLSGKYIVDEISSVFKRENKNLIVDKRFEILRDLIIEDRPNEPNKVASYLYDNEGIRSKNVVLIDKGVLRECLTDLNSAERMGLDSNGHALSEAYVFSDNDEFVCVSPEPRISNLFVRNYKEISDEKFYHDIKEFCKKAGFDFYLKVKSVNGSVNLENGVFDMFTDEIVKVYFDGREETVAGGTLSGSLFDFIASTVFVGSHVYEKCGVCGSSSGFVPTTGNTPFMFLYGINFVPDKKPESIDDNEIDIKNKYFPKTY